MRTCNGKQLSLYSHHVIAFALAVASALATALARSRPSPSPSRSNVDFAFFDVACGPAVVALACRVANAEKKRSVRGAVAAPEACDNAGSHARQPARAPAFPGAGALRAGPLDAQIQRRVDGHVLLTPKSSGVDAQANESLPLQRRGALTSDRDAARRGRGAPAQGSRRAAFALAAALAPALGLTGALAVADREKSRAAPRARREHVAPAEELAAACAAIERGCFRAHAERAAALHRVHAARDKLDAVTRQQGEDEEAARAASDAAASALSLGARIVIAFAIALPTAPWPRIKFALTRSACPGLARADALRSPGARPR